MSLEKINAETHFVSLDEEEEEDFQEELRYESSISQHKGKKRNKLFAIVGISLLVVALIVLIVAFASSPSKQQDEGKKEHDIKIPRACSTPETDKFPFCNPKLPLDTRVKDLISRLHKDEKPPLLTARMSPKGNVSRIGLPEFDWGCNCVHGVKSRCGTRCPTLFASPNGLGATFNMTVVEKMGSIIATELRSLWLQGVGEANEDNLPHIGLDCWSPTININRDPRWGRNEEVSSEDPFLTSQYAIAYTKGLQNGPDKRFYKAVVTLKHWDAYSLEDSDGYTRHTFNAIVSRYDFMDTYFPAFEAAVKDANAKGVMCSYNEVNGVPSCANKFLESVLRKYWKFDGYITSDSGAIGDFYKEHNYTKNGPESVAAGLKAGCDIDSGSIYKDYMIDALDQNLVEMSDVDRSLYRTLKLRFELGLFDPIEDQPYWHIPPDVVNTPETQAFNLESTRQTLVLLKNEEKTLPFPKGKRVAVIGPHANATEAMTGNYVGQVCPGGLEDFSCIVSPFVAIQKKNVGGHTTFVKACNVSEDNPNANFSSAIAAAKNSDYVILMLGIDQSIEREAHDRDTIDLPEIQTQLAKAIIKLNKPTAVVLINGGILSIEWIKENAPAILEAWYPSVEGGKAIADALFGDYNPGGKLPVTVYKNDYVNQVKMSSMSMTKAPGRSYRYFTGTPLWNFGFGLSYTKFEVKWKGSAPKVVHLSNQTPNKVKFEVSVTNVGDREGDEVVQAYFSPFQTPNFSTPLIKQLFGFQRVHLKPKESSVVTFEAEANTFALVDAAGNRVSAPGFYKLEITNGVSEKVSTNIQIEGKLKVLEYFPQH